MTTLIERAQIIRDALDAGVTVAEVRNDVEALAADVELCGVAEAHVLTAPET